MAKLDSSWVFVQPRKSKRFSPSVGQKLVRPKSSMALQFHESAPENAKSPNGLLWRDARWIQTVRETSKSGRLSLDVDSEAEIINKSDGKAMLMPKRFVHVNEQQKFAEYAQRIRQTVNLGEILDFLDDLPISSLIEAIPQSMPLLEAIYTKFYLYDKRKFPQNLLKPEILLTQLLWWVAYQENPNLGSQGVPKAAPSGSRTPKRPEPAFQWKVMVPHMRNILRIIHAAVPEVTGSLRKEQERVEKALEGLGLHGLVNCGQNKLIDVTDAVRIEVSAHYQLVKGMSQQLEKLVQKSPKHENAMTMFLYSINGEGSAPVPSKSSHQRLMSLRLSTVRERLNKNEFTLQILRAAMRNPDLESLERILQKRILCDKEITYQFNVLQNQSNPNYSIIGEDPVVVEILVQFRRAYDKLLGLLPPAPPERQTGQNGSSPSSLREDSGFGEDYEEDGSGGCSSPEFLESSQGTQSSSGEKNSGDFAASTFNERARDLPANRSSRLLGPVAHLIKSKSKRFHRSLVEIDQNNSESVEKLSQIDISTDFCDKQQVDLLASPGICLAGSKSLSNLPFGNTNSIETSTSLCFDEDMLSYNQRNVITNPEKMEIIRLKSEINRLGTELGIANKRIQQLSPERLESGETDQNSRLLPQKSFGSLPKDYDNPVHPSNAAIQRFSILFSNDRVEITNELNKLPELADSEELQAKIIFSVVVLSFRSVQDTIEKKREKVWDALEISDTTLTTCESIVNDFDNSLCKFLARRAKAESGMKNAKEVTSKIWQTLYDFPSLKTCTRFNRFILDCVQVAWELCAGVDGLAPRYRLEFESKNYAAEKHFRFHSASLRSEEIKRYVWPGLLLFDEQSKSESDTVAYKGVVVT